MLTLVKDQQPSKMYNYREYSDIPQHMQEYVIGVAQVDDIRDLYLNDINDFLNGLIEWNEERNV